MARKDPTLILRPRGQNSRIQAFHNSLGEPGGEGPGVRIILEVITIGGDPRARGAMAIDLNSSQRRSLAQFLLEPDRKPLQP